MFIRSDNMGIVFFFVTLFSFNSIHVSSQIYSIATWGAQSTRNKCDILQNLLFEAPDGKDFHIFCCFRGFRVLHTLWPPFPIHSKDSTLLKI